MKRLLVSGLLLLAFGCTEDATEMEATPLNSFRMYLNNQLWEPSKVDGDDCMIQFHCAWSAWNIDNVEHPYYTIKANRDADTGESFADRNNKFNLQIFDVQEDNYKTDL